MEAWTVFNIQLYPVVQCRGARAAHKKLLIFTYDVFVTFLLSESLARVVFTNPILRYSTNTHHFAS